MNRLGQPQCRVGGATDAIDVLSQDDRIVVGLADQPFEEAGSDHLLEEGRSLAVLDHGQILAQGSIDEFLSSGEASYRVGLGGDGESVINSLVAEPWVTTTTPVGDGVWRVAATDRSTAEKELVPRLLAQGGLVTEIRPEQRSLEEIYLEITDGSEQEEEAVDGD